LGVAAIKTGQNNFIIYSLYPHPAQLQNLKQNDMQFLFGAREHRLRNFFICLGMACAGFLAAVWVYMGS
jgi:hypothetical protein